MRTTNFSRFRMNVAMLCVALAASGCISSDRPKLSPDPLAVAGVSAGYYEECSYSLDSKTGVMEKDRCRAVRVDVRADGKVTVHSPGEKVPSMIVVNRISANVFGAQVGSGDQYYFGILSFDENRRGVVTFVLPRCDFSSQLRAIIESRVGITHPDGDGYNCKVNDISPFQVRSLLRTLSESDGWTANYKYVYVPFDDIAGAQRFQREELLELEKKKSKK